MKSIQVIKGSGFGKYLAAEAYYLSKDGSFALSAGSGAVALGLPETLTRKEFRNLLRGYSPDGSTALVRNAGSPSRIAAWDCSLSAFKDLSDLYSQSFTPDQKRIENILFRAGLAELGFTERNAAFGRDERGGTTRFKRVGLVAAIVLHISSRAGDPQLHLHTIIFNVCKIADRTGAIASKPIYRFKMRSGAIFREELARLLQTELGLRLIRIGENFRIAGVPKQLSKHFSKRRAEIEHYLQTRGLYSAKEASKAALATRAPKQHENRETLFARWQAEGNALGWGPREAERLLEEGRTRLAGKKRQNSRQENQIPTPKQERDESPQKQQRRPKNTNRLPTVHRAARANKIQNQFLGLDVKSKPLFPHAPRWNPASRLELPFITLKASERTYGSEGWFGSRRYFLGKWLWRREASFLNRVVRIGVRQRLLFPKAPFWNPCRDAYLPVVSIDVRKNLQGNFRRSHTAQLPPKERNADQDRERER